MEPSRLNLILEERAVGQKAYVWRPPIVYRTYQGVPVFYNSDGLGGRLAVA